MEELDLFYEFPHKPGKISLLTPVEMRDATLGIFYAINTFCDGKMIEMLDMKFCESMPYVDLNVYHLNEDLRNIWKEFCLFVGALCERERELELLDD